jgi:hypothetical protein
MNELSHNIILKQAVWAFYRLEGVSSHPVRVPAGEWPSISRTSHRLCSCRYICVRHRGNPGQRYRDSDHGKGIVDEVFRIAVVSRLARRRCTSRGSMTEHRRCKVHSFQWFVRLYSVC